MCDVIKNRPIVSAKQNLSSAFQEVDYERKNTENNIDPGVINENSSASVDVKRYLFIIIILTMKRLVL